MPSVDDGSLGLINQIRRLTDEAHVNAGSRWLQRILRQAKIRAWGGSPVRQGVPQDGGSYVLWQVNKDGTGSARGSNLECLIDPPGQFRNVLDHDVPLGATPGNPYHVGFLECVGTDRGRGHLTTEYDQRHAIGKRVLHRGHHVCSPRTGSNEDDAGLARGPSVTFGHMPSALFVPRKNEFEVLGVVDGVEDGENGAPGITEYMLDIMAKHHFVKDLATGHSNEGGVEGITGGARASLQRVDGSWNRLLESRGRRGPTAHTTSSVQNACIKHNTYLLGLTAEPLLVDDLLMDRARSCTRDLASTMLELGIEVALE